MRRGTARHHISFARHVAAVPPDTPIPPSSVPGGSWSSPRVFPQPGPRSQAPGSRPTGPQGLAFPPKAEAGGACAAERATNTNTRGLGDYL